MDKKAEEKIIKLCAEHNISKEARDKLISFEIPPEEVQKRITKINIYKFLYPEFDMQLSDYVTIPIHIIGKIVKDLRDMQWLRE